MAKKRAQRQPMPPTLAQQLANIQNPATQRASEVEPSQSVEELQSLAWQLQALPSSGEAKEILDDATRKLRDLAGA